ncbi:CDP-glycerol glycerophosphotransferase family protein [Vibrio cyclitrophicus]|uniref:CDP-glycerol glycerophosphotransferase family protein n=1 Tax=Vibrio sp. R78045 TaxID=3093868 RepID=UPI00354EFF2D
MFFLKKIYLLIMSAIFFPLTLMKRNANKWIFYSKFGYKDSTRIIFEKSVDDGLDAYYFFDDLPPLNVKKCYSLRFVRIGTWRYFQIMSRGQVVFLTHGLGVLSFLSYRTKIIQLWHGVPIKKILLDSSFDCTKSEIIWINNILIRLYRKRINMYDYILSPGGLCSKYFSSAFGVPIERILTLGSPRHEVMKVTSFSKIAESNVINVLYLPTWRNDFSKTLDVVSSLNDSALNKMLEANNIVINIRPHPYDMDRFSKDNLFVNNKNFKILTGDFDITSEFNMFDAFISDYSSVVFDLAYVNSKILFYVPDYDDYIKEREVYTNICDIAGDSFASDIGSLIFLLEKIFVKNENLTNNIKKIGLVDVKSNQTKNIINFALSVSKQA